MLLYIDDILESIKNIESFTKMVSKDNFMTNKEKQYAVVRAIEIIGEATKNISESFKQKYPEIKWKRVAGMRDVLIHAYFEVKLDKVWNVIKDDLPKLKKQIEEILKKESEKRK